MMPERKWPELRGMGQDWTTPVHQSGSHWIRTLAPFRNILAGEEVGFLDGARNEMVGTGNTTGDASATTDATCGVAGRGSAGARRLPAGREVSGASLQDA